MSVHTEFVLYLRYKYTPTEHNDFLYMSQNHSSETISLNFYLLVSYEALF